MTQAIARFVEERADASRDRKDGRPEVDNLFPSASAGKTEQRLTVAVRSLR